MTHHSHARIGTVQYSSTRVLYKLRLHLLFGALFRKHSTVAPILRLFHRFACSSTASANILYSYSYRTMTARKTSQPWRSKSFILRTINNLNIVHLWANNTTTPFHGDEVHALEHTKCIALQYDLQEE